MKPFQEGRAFRRAHRHLLIFVKGEIAAAIAACPSLDDGDLNEFAHLRPKRFLDFEASSPKTKAKKLAEKMADLGDA